MAFIGNCGYWPYTLGRSVRLYTNECVVDSGMGLMGLCMRDIEDVPNLPQGMANQTDPPPEAIEDDSECDKDVIVEDERIIIEGGGITPITPADDQLLDQDDQEDQTGAKTPSVTVTESLSQMNMDSPTSTLVVSDPPGGNQEA